MKSRRAVTLIELLLAIAILGVTVGVVLRMVAQLQTTFSIVGDQSRKEGWQSLSDQAVLAGVDPNQVLLFRDFGTPVATVASSMPTITSSVESDTNGRRGEVEVSRLIVRHGSTVDPRPAGVGFQVGQSLSAPPPRNEPVPPLPPTILPFPTTWPLPSSMITLSDVITQPGQPSLVRLRANAPTGYRAGLQIISPIVVQAAANAVATADLSITDLAASVTARAWTEYPGDASTDTAIVLPDGRTRWFVPTGGVLQAYEPSPFVTYNFRLAIGQPVLTHLGTEYASGVQINVDWYDREAVERAAPLISTGAPAASIVDWPATTQAHFGANWPGPGMFWQTEFNSSVPGPSTGDLGSFFSSSSLSAWQNVSWVSVRPLLSGWLVSDNYDPFTRSEYTYGWQFIMIPVTLPTPSRSSTPAIVVGSANTFAPTTGSVELMVGAPAQTPTGKPYVLPQLRLGNPRVNLGSDPFNVWTQSTGPDVTVFITP